MKLTFSQRSEINESQAISKINRKNILEAEQADYSVNSLEIGKVTDEIKSIIDSEFIDFNDAQQR